MTLRIWSHYGFVHGLRIAPRVMRNVLRYSHPLENRGQRELGKCGRIVNLAANGFPVVRRKSGCGNHPQSSKP